MPAPQDALPGRDTPVLVPGTHLVLGTPITPPFPEGFERIVVGMGCFWGAERLFWQRAGVYTTAVGYAGGLTPNPTYQEVCTGAPATTRSCSSSSTRRRRATRRCCSIFWEGHDPTQGMRQGNDVGTQYRSGIYWTTEAQRDAALASRDDVPGGARAGAATEQITTEIVEAGPFYYAEDYHQQYLAKNPNGYCGLGGTGVSCPIGFGVSAAG